MADLLTENAIHRTQPINWGAIWAGMFTFAAIWSIFGLLGMAIFVSNANPNAAAPVTGQNWGISAWSIILTTIAMYVAGRVTARLSMSPNRVDGAIHGMVMFGLSVVGTIIIVSVADAVMSGEQAYKPRYIAGTCSAGSLNLAGLGSWP